MKAIHLHKGDRFIRCGSSHSKKWEVVRVDDRSHNRFILVLARADGKLQTIKFSRNDDMMVYLDPIL